MAIKAIINNTEKEIEQIKNSDEQDVDYVYSRIGDTEVEGEPPISIKSIGGNLADYRIYGNTVDGESVGDRTGNLCNNSWEQKMISADTGNATPNTNAVCCDFIPVKPNVTYSCSRTIGNNYNNLRCYGANKDYLGTGADLANKGNPLKQWELFGTFMITDARVSYIRFNDMSNSLNTKYMLVEGAYTAETMPSYEPYGYKVPVTVSNGTDTLTTPIYLPEQIRKVGDEAEYIDYGEQKLHRVRKNLLPNTATSETISGVTVTVNSDHSITFNGTASQTIDLHLIPSTFLLPVGKYRLTGAPSGGSASSYYLRAWYRSSGSIVWITDSGDGINFTLTDITAMLSSIVIMPGQVLNNITFYPMIRKADITDDAYEPYIENTDVDVTLPALSTVKGTNTLSINTTIQPSNIYIKDSFDYKKVFTATRTIEDGLPLNYKSIEDSDSTLKNYRIYGQTSRNLFDMKKFAELCYPRYASVTFADNTLSFTSTDVDAYVNYVCGEGNTVADEYRPSCIDVLPSTTYTISMSSAPKCYISWIDNSYKAVSAYTRIPTIPTNQKSYTFTTPSNCTKLLIRLGKEVTNIGDTFTISNIMLNIGSAPLPYEPYGESVGDRTGNLFDGELVLGSFMASTGEYTFVNNRCISEFINVKSNTTYSLHITGAEIAYIGYYGGEFSFLAPRIHDEFTFVTPNNCNQIRIVFSNYDNSIPIDLTVFPKSTVMLNEGSAPLPYEPYGYKVPVTVSNGTDTLTTPIYLPEQIRKVGDEAEYIDYGEQKQYIETTDGQEKYVVGLNVDFENRTFTRLADAAGLKKGSDFDKFSAFGGRKRCNVADDGTITAYYGDANYKEDGSNGQVMVYQPAFYYKVEPLKTEAQESGIGYHLRNVNYYISNHQGAGFKLHPAFYNEAGDRVDYILLGAYEGCIYDISANAYITDDSQVLNTSEDKFSSIANIKPASGLSQDLTRPNLETICKNRGDGWHSLNVRIASMEQLLMIIELGTMNTQTGAGSNGIVSLTDNTSYNCASITGSTAFLGNASGQATSTISDIGGVQTIETANGKTAYSFRGDENPWGNIWKFVYGVNIWGDGTMNGGVPYVCKDYDFTESKRIDNYESAGFSVPNASGYINALGYSKNFDWLMMPSETGGTSSLPIGDSSNVNVNLNGYRIARLGGFLYDSLIAGGFYWSLSSGVGYRARNVGGRLIYVPQIEKQHIYTTDLDVTLPELPTLAGTNTLSIETEVKPSKITVKGHIK